MLAEFPIPTQVKVNDPITLESVEQMLADRFDRLERLPRNPASAGSKSPLRTRHTKRIANKQVSVLSSNEVRFVAFGHQIVADN